MKLGARKAHTLTKARSEWMRTLTPYAAATLCAVFYLYSHSGAGETATARLPTESTATTTVRGVLSSDAILSDRDSPTLEPTFIAPTDEFTAITDDAEQIVQPSADLPAKLRAAKVSYKPVPKAEVL